MFSHPYFWLCPNPQDSAAVKLQEKYCATVTISALHYTIEQQLVKIRATVDCEQLCRLIFYVLNLRPCGYLLLLKMYCI